MASRKSAPVSKVWFLVIELVGLLISAYLFSVSTSLFGQSELPCTKSKWISCKSAVQGVFSHIGPFSVAAMGCVYYLLQLMLTAGLKDRTAQIFKLLLIAGGLVFVAWLRRLEIIYLKSICLWCWGVALVTLIHTGFLWALAVPPLPRFRPLGIAASVFGGFLILVALVTVAELGIRTGRMLQFQGHTDDPIEETTSGDEAAQENPPGKKNPTVITPKPSRTQTAKPTSSPRASTEPTPPLIKRPPESSPASGQASLPTPATTVTPTPPPAAQLDPEPQLDDSPDVRILRKRGWRHAGSGDSVIKAVKNRPPILLLAYNPFCPDCEKLITKVLNSDQIQNLPVTKICIQEDMVNGQISDWIKEFPSLFLIDAQGVQIWKKVGSTITPDQMAREINAALNPPAPR